MDHLHTQTTTNYNTIKQWVEERNGKPAIVKGTNHANATNGLLRIKFTDQDEDNLELISWDDFFEIFEKNHLNFLFQEKNTKGDKSRFFKFIERGKY